jgi:hypothetical protein
MRASCTKVSADPTQSSGQTGLSTARRSRPYPEAGRCGRRCGKDHTVGEEDQARAGVRGLRPRSEQMAGGFPGHPTSQEAGTPPASSPRPRGGRRSPLPGPTGALEHGKHGLLRSTVCVGADLDPAIPIRAHNARVPRRQVGPGQHREPTKRRDALAPSLRCDRSGPREVMTVGGRARRS